MRNSPILHGKPVENRDWSTNFRGRIYLHASKFWKQSDIEDDLDDVCEMAILDSLKMPEPDVTAMRAAGAGRMPREYVSFPECCQMLGLDADVERVAMLETIDRAVDTDNDEAWARLEELSASEPLDDVEPLFDAPRCVPALDQMVLFA